MRPVSCRFEAELYALTKEEGGRHTPFFSNYRPQFFFRTADVTGARAVHRACTLRPHLLAMSWSHGCGQARLLTLHLDTLSCPRRKGSTDRCFPATAGTVTLPESVEMVMPGDNVTANFELITPVALEPGLRFAVREGSRTVAAGVVTQAM